MSDNITGFGGGSDEISLGLNLNSNVGSTINDFNTLDQVLQQIVKDEETFKGIQNDSFEQAKALTQEIKSSGESAQQLISIFRALRGEQQGSLQDAKQLASTYQQLNNELQKSVQNKTRLGITSPGGSVPGSIPPTGGPGPIPGVPATQTGAGGGGGIIPPNTSPTAGFADEPDDFFGREEVKSGGRRGRGGPSGIDSAGLDAIDLNNIDLERGDALGLGGGGAGRTAGGAAGNEKYKQLSDLAWTIFPNRGYYRNMRRVRWLTRNEGGAINKFVKSGAGQKVGMALNRLGGGNNLRTNEGYQLFPFVKNDKGEYVDDNNIKVDNQGDYSYGLRDSAGNFLQQGGGGLEQPTWSWSGKGEMPPMPTEGTPVQFDPWERPNLTATGEGAAKIAGSMYALSVIRAKGGDLFREGQLYTGITGGTGIAGALKYDLGAQATSWFGLNPLESYGQAKQINMQNLALGYRGNLLNQANSFGNQALQKYGVDPQTSMQMFGQMVMQAGASLEDLNASLSTLAHTASTTNTSFSQLQQGVIQYSQIGGNIGLTGSQNALFATAASQYAAGQPALAAAGGNPADILDSMVGQALVAQQMGTSFLGLPEAIAQQGGGKLLDSTIKVNEELLNRIGINKDNYRDKKALRNSFFKYRLLMNALGRHKEANEQFSTYEKDIGDMFSGKSKKEWKKTVTSAAVHAMSGPAGESLSEALAHASGVSLAGGQATNAITKDMYDIESRDKWENIGVMQNGKFVSLSEIEKLPQGRREALLARIGTGDQPLSHINKSGALIKGNYANGTYLDLKGEQPLQYSEYGRTPNRAKMQAVEQKAMTIELGQHAKKYFYLLDNPNGLNRSQDNYNKGQGAPISDIGTRRTSNIPKT